MIIKTSRREGVFPVKATGVVRRIDDLGRVVIPKEIRRTMRIHEGDPLEIFIDKTGEVILKKYAPIAELNQYAKEYTDSLHEALGHIACVSDMKNIIAVSGASKKELLNKTISTIVEQSLEEKQVKIYNEPCALTDNESLNYTSSIIAPITAKNEVIGAVILASKNTGTQMGALESKLIETAAGFLAKQMERSR